MKKTARMIGFSLGLILCGGSAALSQVGADKRRAPTPTPTPRPTSPPPATRTVTASGEVQPIRFINVTSEVSGRIQEIYASPGEQVTKGQVLVRIDSSQEANPAATQGSANEVQNARNVVATAQQELVVAAATEARARQVARTSENEFNRFRRELERITQLVESEVASRAEYDAARDRYDQAKAKLDTQNIAIRDAVEHADKRRAAVKEAQANLRSSERRANQQDASLRGASSKREKAIQLSPLNGIVTAIPTQVGDIVVSNPTGKPLLVIADMSTVNVEVTVNGRDLPSIKVGQRARVKVTALGDKEFNGIVTQKHPRTVAKPDTEDGLANRVNFQKPKEFKIVVELRQLSHEVRNALRPGMSATATFTTRLKGKV